MRAKFKLFGEVLNFDWRLFLFTSALGLITSYFTTNKPDKTFDIKDFLETGASYSILVFIACELVKILSSLKNFERKFGEGVYKMEVHNKIMHSFMRAFEIEDLFIRDVVIKTMREFPSAVDPGDNIIKLISNNFGFGVYKNLWTNLIEFQKSNPDKKIVVRATHSASIDLWETQISFTALQREFCKRGTIFRILIRNNELSGDFDDYDKLTRQMRSLGVKVFFMESSKLPVFHDYLICEFDDKSYVLAWRWEEIQRYRRGASIEGCDLYLGGDYYREHKEKWESILNKLIVDDSKDVPAHLGALRIRPTEEEINQMRFNFNGS